MVTAPWCATGAARRMGACPNRGARPAAQSAPQAPGASAPGSRERGPVSEGQFVAAPAASDAAATDAAALPAVLDLSMDRAQALERYTHGLLAPLVELLRERDAALERRE